MKDQALFSSKDKSKQLKCLLLQFLFGALRVTYFRFSKYFSVHFGNTKSRASLVTTSTRYLVVSMFTILYNYLPH